MNLNAILRKTVLTLVPAAAFVMIAAPAHADLLVDPYLGYTMGSGKFETAGGSAKVSDTGPVIGARVGVAFPLIWAALDASVLTGGKSDPDSGANGDVDATMIGITAGVKVPFLRGYLGYLLKNDWKYNFGSGTNTFQGTGIKLGASFTGLPFIALNLEYLMSSFSKVKYSSGGDEDVSGGHTYRKVTENAVILSVSAPFEF